MYTVNLGNGSIGYFPGPEFSSKDILEKYRMRYDTKDKMFHVDDGKIEVHVTPDETEAENWIMLANVVEEYKYSIGLRLKALRDKVIKANRKFAYKNNSVIQYANRNNNNDLTVSEQAEYDEYQENSEILRIWDNDIYAFEDDSLELQDFSYLNSQNKRRRNGPPTAPASYQNSYYRNETGSTTENGEITPYSTEVKTSEQTNDFRAID